MKAQNHPGRGTIARQLLLDALKALQDKAFIEGRLVEPEPAATRHPLTDALVDLTTENGPLRYLVECKVLVDRKSQIDQVRRHLHAIGLPGLLVAPYLTRELAEHCRSTGLQFIDSCGNAYLHAPGLFVLITGERSGHPRQSFRGPKGLTNAAGLRVVLALLSTPGLIDAPFKDIARHAGVSLGAAYNALNDLEQRRYAINGGGARQRSLLEPGRLIDEWTINYPNALRPKLHGRRFRAPSPDWWQSLDVGGLGAAWGSEVAASKMTGYLKPVTQTLYAPAAAMDDVIGTLVKQHRLRPDPQGEVEILEKFWHWPADGGIAPPLLVYADLLAILDPRAQETARMIKERFIDPVFDPS